MKKDVTIGIPIIMKYQVCMPEPIGIRFYKRSFGTVNVMLSLDEEDPSPIV